MATATGTAHSVLIQYSFQHDEWPEELQIKLPHSSNVITVTLNNDKTVTISSKLPKLEISHTGRFVLAYPPKYNRLDNPNPNMNPILRNHVFVIYEVKFKNGVGYLFSFKEARE